MHWICRLPGYIVPGDQRFDPHLMASSIDVQHADLANQVDAERITGYRVGGMSPFAMHRKVPVVV